MEENLDTIRKVVKEILAAQNELSQSTAKVEKKPRKPYTRRDLEAYERSKETNLMSRKLTNAIQHAEKLQRFREEDWVKLQQSSLLTHPKLAPKKQRLEYLFQPIMEVDEPAEVLSPLKARPEKRRAEESMPIEILPFKSLQTQNVESALSSTSDEIKLPTNIFASMRKSTQPFSEHSVVKEIVFQPKVPKAVPLQPEAIEPSPEEVAIVLPPIVKKQQETVSMQESEEEDEDINMYLQMLA